MLTRRNRETPPQKTEPTPFAAKAKDLGALRDAVVDAAGVGNGLWLSYLFVLFYFAIATFAVTHRDLLLENPVKLPFLNVERFYQPKAAIADLMAMPPIRVRRISRPMAARKTCGSCSAGGTRDHRVRVIFRPCRVRRTTSPSAMRCDQRKPISWK